MLCLVCSWCFLEGSLSSKLSNSSKQAHHNTASSFSEAVEAGCTVCRAVSRSLERRGHKLRDDRQPVTTYVLRQRKKSSSRLAKLFTVYWMKVGDGFLQEKTFSLEASAYISPTLGHQMSDSSTLALQRVFELANNWITHCVLEHPICKKAQNHGFVPTRLICVLPGPYFEWKLCVTNEDPGQYQKYLALSHRWGSAKFLGLLESNLEALRKGQLLSELPRTFQDAVTIARQLCFDYIWVDSICIMQDSQDDWIAESRLMGQVYSNASCTIAALWAHDAHQGFLQRQNDPNMWLTLVRSAWIDTQPEEYYVFEDRMWLNTVARAPLNLRAWVLQERILSPRVLYFHEAQVFFECHEQTACEIFPYALPFQMKSTPAHSSHSGVRPSTAQIVQNPEYYHRNPYGFWRDVVNRYSECSLSKLQDRLIAVSGVAQFVAKLTGDFYVAGLWQRYLQKHLMWTTIAVKKLRELPIRAVSATDDYVAPTWSWASILGAVSFPPHYADEDDLSLIDIVKHNVDYVTDESTGQIQGAHLEVNGTLIPARYSFVSGSTGRLSVNEFPDDDEASVFWDIMPTEAVNGLFCLPFYHYVGPEINGAIGDPTVDGMLLQKVATVQDQYQRVGIFSLSGRDFCVAAGVSFSFAEEGSMGELNAAASRQRVILV